MTNLRVLKYGEMDMSGAVAIVGFPSVGLVSSLITSFLAKELKLELVAGITSDEFPPYTIVSNGTPMPQIRIFAGPRNIDGIESGIDRKNLIIVTTEFIPKLELHSPVVRTIMDWLEMHNADIAITLEGTPQSEPEVYSIAGSGSTEKAREMLKNFDIPVLGDGIVRGMPGLMLMEGACSGKDVITIIGSAKTNMPDPRGAAKLLEPLKVMLPELNIDPEPFLEEARELDERMGPQGMGLPTQDDGFLYG